MLSPLGRISEALADLSKAIQLQPSARLYRHRGTLLFISEVWWEIKCPAGQCAFCRFGATVWALSSLQDYVASMEDFQQSLELKKNQPIAMLYKGLTFFHRGLLKVCFCCCFCSESFPFKSWFMTTCVILYEILLHFPGPHKNIWKMSWCSLFCFLPLQLWNSLCCFSAVWHQCFLFPLGCVT